MDRGAWQAPWGHKELDTTEGLNSNNLSPCICTMRIVVAAPWRPGEALSLSNLLSPGGLQSMGLRRVAHD